MTKMIYALCVCVFNLLKIYTNLPLAERGPRAAAIYPGPAAAAAMPVQGAHPISREAPSGQASVVVGLGCPWGPTRRGTPFGLSIHKISPI